MKDAGFLSCSAVRPQRPDLPAPAGLRLVRQPDRSPTSPAAAAGRERRGQDAEALIAAPVLAGTGLLLLLAGLRPPAARTARAA